MSGISLRRATSADLDWANARYGEADFLPSDPTHLVLIAEVQGAPAGLGRLVPAGAGAVELGGMYVLPAHRGRGVAAALVRGLLGAAGTARVYCIPWDDLAGWYERAGFARVADESAAPAPVREKLGWCRAHYARAVRLLEYVPRGAA